MDIQDSKASFAATPTHAVAAELALPVLQVLYYEYTR